MPFMKDRRATRDRILEANCQLVNHKSCAATALAEIAANVGIAQGNLSYHFPSKRDLVIALEADARQSVRINRDTTPTGNATDDYVEALLFSMNHIWDNRFLLRDRAQFTDDSHALRLDPDMAADQERLHELLRRMKKEGLFRRDLQTDLRVLARPLFIVSRY